MSEVSSVEDRLGYLEEQNAGLKRCGLLLLILVLIMGATMIYDSSGRSRAVQTEGLIINAAGKPRAALSAMPTGHLGLLFYDHQGNLPREVQYASIPYLDGFAVYDREGRPRIHVGMDSNDNPVLLVVSPDGKTVFSALPVEPQTANPEPAATPAQPSATPTP